jgi:hypothetical protein
MPCSFERTPRPPQAAAVAAILAIALGVFPACSKAARMDQAGEAAPAPPPAFGAVGGVSPTLAVAQPGGGGGGARSTVETSTRRVIRTAELSLEADHPDVVEQKVAALADTRGGFVLSADTSRSRSEDGAEQIEVTVVFRVPAAAFDPTLETLRGLGTHVSNEKVTGQDVTEEYVDLEARIKAQRALEEQFLAILKEAKTIPDVLAVEQKLGEVRTEIERAEGRRRFLESQTSLSTFTVHLARHIEAVEASGPGFGASIRRAGRDAIEVAVAIVNGAIRLVGVLAPVGLLLGLPMYLGVRALVRRRRRLRSAAG